MRTIVPVGIESSYMKTLSLIIAAFFLIFGVAASSAAVLTRISDETGVPVDTLQTERASTGLGYGELETAHLLANASGQNFDDIVAMHKAGEGWGKIAHDNGLNLGKIVSSAHRSDQAASHAQNAHTQTTHGKTSSIHGKGHAVTGKAVGRGPSVKSGHGHGGH
jgi:hypothetical protein